MFNFVKDFLKAAAPLHPTVNYDAFVDLYQNRFISTYTGADQIPTSIDFLNRYKRTLLHDFNFNAQRLEKIHGPDEAIKSLTREFGKTYMKAMDAAQTLSDADYAYLSLARLPDRKGRADTFITLKNDVVRYVLWQPDIFQSVMDAKQKVRAHPDLSPAL